MRSKILTTTAVLAAVLAAVGVAQTSNGQQLTESLGLSAPREGFTELYFSHPATLGTESVRDGARKLESFVIDNQEHARMSYSWIIQPGANGTAVRGSVSVEPGRRVTVEHRVTVSCAQNSQRRAPRDHATTPTHPTRVPVRVTLTGRSESLTDWVTCYG